MRNRRIAAIVLAVAVAGLTIAATSASARPEHANGDGEGAPTRPRPAASSASSGSRRSTSPAASIRRVNTSARRSASTRTCSCARSSATTTSPALPGNVLVPDLATNLGVVTNGGKTYTFHAQERHQVRPAAEPRDHVQGRALGVRAHRHQDRRRAVRLLLRRHQGHDGLQGRQVQGHRGHQDARPEDDHLHADEAHGRLPATASACRPPARSRRKSRDASRSRTSTAATSSPRART